MGALSAVLPQGRGSLEPVGDAGRRRLPEGRLGRSPADVDRRHGLRHRAPGGLRPRRPHRTRRCADAVMASCAIPGWYAPVRIGGRRYVDGGACSPTSVDLVLPLELDEVVVLSPMTSLDYDRPTTAAGRLERRFRRLVTKRLVGRGQEGRRDGHQGHAARSRRRGPRRHRRQPHGPAPPRAGARDLAAHLRRRPAHAHAALRRDGLTRGRARLPAVDPVRPARPARRGRARRRRRCPATPSPGRCGSGTPRATRRSWSTPR